VLRRAATHLRLVELASFHWVAGLLGSRAFLINLLFDVRVYLPGRRESRGGFRGQRLAGLRHELSHLRVIDERRELGERHTHDQLPLGCGKRLPLSEWLGIDRPGPPAGLHDHAAPAAAEIAVPDGCEVIEAPFGGVLWSWAVADGDRVEAGQTIAVIEAMKMESPVLAPCAGRVRAVYVTERQPVTPGAPLLALEPA